MSATSPNTESGLRFGTALEHKALRDEILKRIEMRQQIVAVALTLAGVFLGVGLTRESVALIYPPLATLLALGWAQNDFRIRGAAKYIREVLETSDPSLSLRYETYMHKERGSKKGSLGSWRFIVLSHGGVFFSTQLMAIGIEFSKRPFKTLQWSLLAVDSLAVITVGWLMIRALGRGKAAPETLNSKEVSAAINETAR